MVILVCGEDFSDAESLGDFVFRVPAGTDILSSFVTVLFSQLLSYEVATMRGCDVDHPRNLAKSVTVE